MVCAAGGTNPASRVGGGPVWIRQPKPAFRSSDRPPPGSRKNSNYRYGPPPFSGEARVARGLDGPKEALAAGSLRRLRVRRLVLERPLGRLRGLGVEHLIDVRRVLLGPQLDTRVGAHLERPALLDRRSGVRLGFH